MSIGAVFRSIPGLALVRGFRLNPELDDVLFPPPLHQAVNGPSPRRLDRNLGVERANRLGAFQMIERPQDVSFLFNIVDSGSGRELQNLPVHNIAGLGNSTGERPFRMLGRPLAFLPRSSVRLQVEQQSHEIDGTLHVALHGYKILGAAGVTDDQLRGLYQRAMRKFGLDRLSQLAVGEVERGIVPSAQIVPFDYVGQLTLDGVRRRVHETEININVEGGFVAASIGYSLRVPDRRITLNLRDLCEGQQDDGGTGETDAPNTERPGGAAAIDDCIIDLADVPLTSFRDQDLQIGFRIKPELVPLAFFHGRLHPQLPASTVQELFEPLNLPEQVSFRYSIEDTGTGRAWQNAPINNIAGLGVADGDRPFREFAWPMHFLPRSTIRLRVEEGFGKGELYIVFHGYKKLGVP